MDTTTISTTTKRLRKNGIDDTKIHTSQTQTQTQTRQQTQQQEIPTKPVKLLFKTKTKLASGGTNSHSNICGSCNSLIGIARTVIALTGLVVSCRLLWKEIHIGTTSIENIKLRKQFEDENILRIYEQPQESNFYKNKYTINYKNRVENVDDDVVVYDSIFSWVDTSKNIIPTWKRPKKQKQHQEQQQDFRKVIGYYGYESIVGEEVISSTEINRYNSNGMYWHNIVNSPYDSYLYLYSNDNNAPQQHGTLSIPTNKYSTLNNDNTINADDTDSNNDYEYDDDGNKNSDIDDWEHSSSLFKEDEDQVEDVVDNRDGIDKDDDAESTILKSPHISPSNIYDTFIENPPTDIVEPEEENMTINDYTNSGLETIEADKNTTLLSSIVSTTSSFMEYIFSIQQSDGDSDDTLFDSSNDDDNDEIIYYATMKESLLFQTDETDHYDEELKQDLYVSKVQATVEQYGQWEISSSLEECMGSKGMGDNDDSATSTLSSSWVENCSHSDILEFVQQAKLLIHRVQEGIYDEYGMSLVDIKERYTEKSINRRRMDSFGIQVIDYNDNTDVSINKEGIAIDLQKPNTPPLSGGAYINQAGYDGLVRKLLHAIITNDDFYVVAVGGSNLYNGNNWFQNQIMQFQYIMEPVFDKLGISLISRNMGMDVSSTTINSLGGADIYGESDIIWHIPDHRSTTSTSMRTSTNARTKPKTAVDTKDNSGPFDLLHIQSILSGQRIPLILTPNPGTLIHQPNISNVVWMGNIQHGISVCSYNRVSRWNTKSNVEIDACQYIGCNGYDPTFIGTNLFLGDIHDDECLDQYSAVCWIERHDWNPPLTKKGMESSSSSSSAFLPYQEEGFPNPNQHILESRKLAMLVLHALDEAIYQWETDLKQQKKHQQQLAVIEIPTSALPNKELWDVQDVYNNIKEQVRIIPSTSCDSYLQEIAPEICHMQMHAYTEWTPRVTPTTKRLKTLIQEDVADYSTYLSELYQGVDLLSTLWEPNLDRVDVHMIATVAKSDTDFLLNHNNRIQRSSTSSNSQGHDNITNTNNDATRSGIDANNWILENVDNKYDDDDDDDTDDDDGDDATFEGSEKSDLSQRDTMVRHRFLRTEPRRSTYHSDPRYRVRQQKLYAEDGSRTTSWSGWSVVDQPIGYCDGSSESRCNRALGNDCLLANHNHYKSGIMGNGKSGPVQLHISDVKEGIILARFEWISGLDTMKELPADFVFVYTIDGDRTEFNKNEFIEAAAFLASDIIIHPLMIDKVMMRLPNIKKLPKTIQLDIEVITGFGSDASITLTHLYYA